MTNSPIPTKADLDRAVAAELASMSETDKRAAIRGRRSLLLRIIGVSAGVVVIGLLMHYGYAAYLADSLPKDNKLEPLGFAIAFSSSLFLLPSLFVLALPARLLAKDAAREAVTNARPDLFEVYRRRQGTWGCLAVPFMLAYVVFLINLFF